MAMSEAAAAVLRFLASGGEKEEAATTAAEEEAATSAGTSEEETEVRGRGGFPEPSPDPVDRLVIFTQSFFFGTVTKSRACLLVTVDYYNWRCFIALIHLNK